MYIDIDEADIDTVDCYEQHGFVNIPPGKEYRMLRYLREL